MKDTDNAISKKLLLLTMVAMAVLFFSLTASAEPCDPTKQSCDPSLSAFTERPPMTTDIVFTPDPCDLSLGPPPPGCVYPPYMTPIQSPPLPPGKGPYPDVVTPTPRQNPLQTPSGNQSGKGPAEEAGEAIGIAICGNGCGEAGKLIGKFIDTLFGWKGGKSIEDMYEEKEYDLDVKERENARALLTTMQNLILKTLAEGGRDKRGNATTTWVNNWRNFERDSQDKARREIFPAMIYDAALGENATICPYMAETVAELFGAKENTKYEGMANEYFRANSDQPFNLVVRCTLPEGFDYDAYMADPSYNPEIEALLREPQNNLSELVKLTKDELNNQITTQDNTEQNVAISNQGNVGIRDEDGNILTPGSILNQVGAKAITSELDWLISVDEFKEIVVNANGRVNEILHNMTIEKLPGLLPPPNNDAKPCQDIECMGRFVDLIAEMIKGKKNSDDMDKLNYQVEGISKDVSGLKYETQELRTVVNEELKELRIMVNCVLHEDRLNPQCKPYAF